MAGSWWGFNPLKMFLKCALSSAVLGLLFLFCFGAEVWAAGPFVGQFVNERRIRTLDYVDQYDDYSPARQLVQDQIILRYGVGGVATDRPRIIFTAGPFGAGKSTELRKLGESGFFKESDFCWIDPDEIKEGIPEYESLKKTNPDEAATLVHPESMYLSDLAVEHALLESKNIIYETSLRNYPLFLKMLQRIRKVYPQYQVEIVHVLSNLELILRQVEERAQKTGRRVPRQQIQDSIEESALSVEKLTNTPLVDYVLQVDRSHQKRVIKVVKNTIPLEHFDRSSHIAIDVDGALISRWMGPLDGMTAWNVIEVEGVWYRVSEGVDRAFSRWLLRPNLNISFLSGGSEARSIELLRKIKPPSLRGKSLYDVAYRIVSAEQLGYLDLTAAERYRPLSKISHHLDQIILLNDAESFLQVAGSEIRCNAVLEGAVN